ncbi:MAG TPA: UDP-N-acetylmuramoyl-tripeptide--D-alanyl-D-alanine ligase [Patescibacteria group bacterium]|nr:UDP-N-acetylmuramoyl-tripeptide--D-alanyl-D-alanine ligase [Patescibacteria group bacterium]
MKKVNPILQWWVTPKLPYEDVFELPLLIDKNPLKIVIHFFSNWFIHPIKRRLAKKYLEFLRKFTDIKVIGITGSSGKTTTTQMLASICSHVGRTVWSRESIDPVYNIPNTILRAGIDTKYLILEMGVEYPGEMDFYLWMAVPDVAAITNIFPTHLEFFGDVDGVLKEKSKLVLGLSKNGVAVLNESYISKSILSQIKARVLKFKIISDPIIQNSEIALTVAVGLGIDSASIETGIKNYQKPKHRLSVLHHKSGAIILDDSYNNNPEAALSSLSYFGKMAKDKKMYAVIGDMKQLGQYEESSHRQIGKVIAKMGFSGIIAVGKASKYLIEEIKNGSKNTETVLVDDEKSARKLITQYLKNGNYILIKGSRSIGLDKLVDTLV